ncbi:MAG TPA: hypothetical protein VGM06_05300 [Polyangiaceae bacterium]
MKLALRRVRVATLGGVGLLAIAGCGDLLGFDRGASVSCVQSSDCAEGAVCREYACVATCVAPDCDAGLDAASGSGGDTDGARCQVPCATPNLCLGGVCVQAGQGPPYGPASDMPVDVQPNALLCSEVDISVCEWISGVGVDFAYPPGGATYRFGVYQDTKNYPTQRLAETDSMQLSGESAQVGLANAVPVHCDDSGAAITPIWLCIATTAMDGYELSAASSGAGDIVQLNTMAEEMDQWASSGLPDPWPAPPADYVASAAPAPLLSPLFVPYR